jgi:hypothetical protein
VSPSARPAITLCVFHTLPALQVVMDDTMTLSCTLDDFIWGSNTYRTYCLSLKFI